MTQRNTYRGRRFQSGLELERVRTHWDGVPDSIIERARTGQNLACVECWANPIDGGLRCLDCFRKIARPKNPTGCGTPAGHKMHRHRGEPICPRCRQAWARDKAGRKAAA